MSEAYFYLGKTRLDPAKFSTKIRLLNKAAASRLPVPLSVVVRDEALSIALLRGLVRQDERGYITCDNPRALVDWLDLPTFGRLVAVRAAFRMIHTDNRLSDDQFDTVLKINANDPHDICEALCKVWSSTADVDGDFRRDIILMQMVDSAYAGIARVETGYADDLIRYTEGLGMDVIAGLAEGQILRISRRWRSEFVPSSHLSGWTKRLQMLLRNIRRIFGNKDWRVKFADDGERCYVLQIQPVRERQPRDDIFTHASFRENLPDVPSPFMTDIIQSCSDELFAYYRRFDATLPDDRAFIQVFQGRPYMNLSLLTDMLRRFGLPTRLVTEHLGEQKELQDRLRWRRIAIKTAQGVLPRLVLAQMTAPRRVSQATDELNQRMEKMGQTLPELTETLRDVYSLQMRTLFSLNTALSPLLGLLRQAGTLEEHSRQQETITTKMYYDQRLMRDYARRNDDVRAAMQRGHLPDDDYFGHLWDYYMERYGHRGAYEQDIARPRYHDDPAPLLKSLTHPYRAPTEPERTLRGRLTLPLWIIAEQLTQSRETWQHTVLKALYRLRTRLLERAAVYVQKGVLPDVDDLWLLRLDEVRQLPQGWQPPAALFDERQTEMNICQSYELPDVIRRFDDFSRYRKTTATPPRRQRMQGISLTDAQATGRVWVLDAPSTELPEGFTPETTILIARSVDAGWVPTFALVAGVAVETGSDLSSGSVVLREMGLPAITQVGSVTQVFQTGDTVILRAGRGVIERTETADDTDDIADVVATAS